MKGKRRLTAILSILLLLAFILPAIPVAADPSPTLCVIGASIRIEGVQGLRFVGKIAKMGFSLTFGENANFGFLLIPKSRLAAGTQITKDTAGVKQIPARYLLTDDSLESVGITPDENCYFFSGVLTGIPEEFYGTDVIARIYVNEGGSYCYSEPLERSVQYIAEKIYLDPAYSDGEKQFARDLLDIFEDHGSDILIPGEKVLDAEPLTSPQSFGAYRYIAVIGVDGGGSFFRDANTPNIDQIFANGAIGYDVLTSIPTVSAQCWGSLMHGVTANVHKLTNDLIANTPYPTDSVYPSIFRVIRENDPSAELASFVNWQPINTGIVEDGLDVYKASVGSDETLKNQICEYLENTVPTLLFVQFDEADAAGHSGGYGSASYYDTLERLDGYIGEIYDQYEAQGVLDQTLFIVTADHGGTGKSHGGSSDAERYVMFAAAGKTVEKNGTIEEMEIRDTAAIVTYALGLESPERWTARVPSGLFAGVNASVRPVYLDKASERYHVSEPTPVAGSGSFVTDSITEKSLYAYLPMDHSAEDLCGGSTSTHGTLYYTDGYFGEAVALDDGYITLSDYAPGTDSFTISLWILTYGTSEDPSIFSNKDWASGKNPGYILSLRKDDIKFNFGDGSNRMDEVYSLPADFDEGWMHLILIVDRSANKIRFCYDFGEVSEAAIPANLSTASLTNGTILNIGQDGTGIYSHHLSAMIDELMIFEGALTDEEIAALATYYGKTV